MSVSSIRAAVAAVALGLGLAAAPGHASVNVPIINPGFADSPNHLNGWTAINAVVPSNGQAEIGVNQDTAAADNAIGIYFDATMDCVRSCPGTSTNMLTQDILSLVTGHTYELSFYLVGLNNPGNTGNQLLPITPMTVMLGSQSSGPINPPYITNVNAPLVWGHEVVDFTYTGASSTAALAFVQHFSGAYMGCVPCGEGVYFSGIRFTDLSATEPPPTPTSEPSTLAVLGLGLGALGVFGRRRLSRVTRIRCCCG